MKVGVKFCGNCNPYIDTVALLNSIKNNLRDIELVRWDESEFSVLMILNSCPVGCASHPDFTGPKIVVTSDGVNYEPVLPEDLLDRILEVLGSYL